MNKRNLYTMLALVVLVAGIGATILLADDRATDGAQGASKTPAGAHYQWSDVTYSYESSHLPSVETNPDWVTRWVTPAPIATTEASGAEWHPTAQAPGLSTLAPGQIPDPTLICVTNCK